MNTCLQITTWFLVNMIRRMMYPEKYRNILGVLLCHISCTRYLRLHLSIARQSLMHLSSFITKRNVFYNHGCAITKEAGKLRLQKARSVASNRAALPSICSQEQTFHKICYISFPLLRQSVQGYRAHSSCTRSAMTQQDTFPPFASVAVAS